MDLPHASGIYKSLRLPNATILQSPKGQGVSTATAALYEYTLLRLPRKPLRLIEAGSGSGVLAIMLKQANPAWEVCGLEIQSHLYALACENAAKLELDVDFILEDLRLHVSAQKYHCIVANPPWQKLDSGISSPFPERAISRSELYCTLPDMLRFCDRNLLSGAAAFLLYPASRKNELIKLLPETSLELSECRNADRLSLIYHIIKG